MDLETARLAGKLLAAGAVMSLVLSLGLGVTREQLLWIGRRPALLLRAVLAVLVLAPLVALLAALGLGADRPVVIGVVLMGVSPAAPLVLRRAREAGGDPSFGPGLQVVLALLAIGSVPLSLALLARLFPASQAAISPWTVAAQVGRVQLGPLAVGVAVGALWPAAAARAARPLARLGAVLLLVFGVMAVAARGFDLLLIGPRAYLAMAVTLAATIALGHLLGGPARETRTVLAVASAMRNPGLALLIVQLNFAGRGVESVVLGYVLMTLLFLTAYVTWWRRAGRAAA